LALSVALLAAGCAYYNSLYNANQSYDEAERARREGREAFAQAKYAEAIDKAAKSYRSSEDGRWADDALYLIGRSHARRGDWEEARAALEAALDITDSETLAAGARVYLAAADVSLGREAAGLALLDSALTVLEGDETRAEAFLWRARARYGVGDIDPVWADLDSAEVGGDRYRTEAALDRLAWGVDSGQLDQAARGAEDLMSSAQAVTAADTILRAVEASWDRWGATATLPVLADAEQATWSPADRNGLRVLRAQIAYEAGDTLTAFDDARDVSSGVGTYADAARVLLARWELAEMEEPAELDDVRTLLLPAVGSREALALLDAIKAVGLLVERSQRDGQALALFAAAELSRDSLGSPGVSRTLFVAYADLEPGSAWEGKALLAALAMTTDPGERAAIEDRLSAIPENTYVVASRWELGDRQAEYSVVERRLQGVMATIQAQVSAEAQARDVIVGQAARALDSIRATEAIARRLAEGDSTVLDSIRLDSIRLDSLRLDSIRADSTRGLDSLFADTLPPDTLGGRGREPLRPLFYPLREPEAEATLGGTSGVPDPT
jgi:hypothetical protein